MRYTKSMVLLFIHIAAALSGLAQATYTLASPSSKKLNVTFGLLATTIASGTWLVVTLHASVLSACNSGLVYSTVVLGMLAGARYRLARQVVRIRK